MTTAEHKIKF